MRQHSARFFAMAKPSPISERFSRPQGYRYEPDQPLAQEFRARSGVQDGERPTITIFDYIGDDGFSDARMSAALRSIGANRDIVVEMNSPGGDYFQGVAIYNMLQRHQGAVTVQVLGLAASAASLIAMAAAKIELAQNSELMIHKAWGMTVGNSDDHVATTETLQHLDQAMADVYAARAGREPKEMLRLMAHNGGAGTFFRGQAAIDMGLADAFIDVQAEKPAYADASDDLPSSLREWDRKLAGGAKLTKAERRALFNDVRGKQDAAASAKQDAGVLASLYRLASTQTSI